MYYKYKDVKMPYMQ